MNGSARLVKVVSRAGMVALDSMVFVYQFEDYPEYADLTEAIFRLFEEGKVSGVTSVVTAAEVFSHPKVMDDMVLLAKYRAVFRDMPGLTVNYPTLDDSLAVGGIRIRYGLRLPDAFQVVAGLTAGAKVLVTNDQRLERVKEPKVILLKDYLD